MQQVKFQFYEYILPKENVGFADPLFLFVSETFGFAGYRNEVKFDLTLEEPEFLLDRKTELSIAGAVIGRDKAADFKIKRWTYSIDEEKKPEVNVYLEEIKPAPLERYFEGLKDSQKYGTVIVIFGVVLLLILGGIGVIASYPEPLPFWSFVGSYIRRIVALMLFITTSVFTIWLYVKYKKSAIAREFIGAIGGIMIFAIPLAWALVSVPPQTGSEFEPIAYLDFLRSRISSSVLLLAGVVPWLLIFLKYFGWDLIASLVGQAAKKEKSP